MASGTSGKTLKRWGLRAAGSAVLLGILFSFLPREAILQGIRAIPLWEFVVVWLAFLAGHMVAAGKWRLLLDRELPLLIAIKAHFAGLAANLCLPGVAGGDAVRAAVSYGVMRDGPRIAAAAATDRLLDMLALAGLCVAGVMMADSGAGRGAAWTALALIVVISGAVVWLAPKLVVLLWQTFPKLPARSLAFRTAEALEIQSRAPGRLALVLALSVTIQGTFIWLAYQLARAVGVEVPLAAWAFAWALAKIIAVLPISLGGLGLREASLAALLAPFGADAAQVVAAGLAWQAVLFLTGGLGALVLSLSGLRLRADGLS